MNSGFSHFDSSHRENFIAAVLLLLMEVDDGVTELVSRLVRERLGIGDHRLIGFGREARLEVDEDGSWDRVDIKLLFDDETSPFDVFVEVKTRNDWPADHVAQQVRDQAKGTTARVPHEVRGCVLLAPERLCNLVHDRDDGVRMITWKEMLRELRALPAATLTTLAIRHMEENVERAAGLDRPITLSHFEQATTTIACLRRLHPRHRRDCLRSVP